VSKFVCKFRKHKDYKDDHDYAKDFLNSKSRRSELPEVKKKLMELAYKNADDDDDDYNDEYPDD
jgi:SOS response regulatory protein OraA/RecX